MPTAIFMHQTGAPEVLQFANIAKAPLAANEIRLRIIAAPVSQADLAIRSGRRPLPAAALPHVPGIEGIGDVVELGSDVQTVRLGERVMILPPLPGIDHPGSYQQYLSVDAASVVVVDKELPAFDLAALGLPAVLALIVLQRLELASGDTVLVPGSGNELDIAVEQVARALGQRTITGPVSEADLESLHQLAGSQPPSHLPESVAAVVFTADSATPAEATRLQVGRRLGLLSYFASDDDEIPAQSTIFHQHIVAEKLAAGEARQAFTQLCAWLETAAILVPAYELRGLSEAALVHAQLEAGLQRRRMLLTP